MALCFVELTCVGFTWGSRCPQEKQNGRRWGEFTRLCVCLSMPHFGFDKLTKHQEKAIQQIVEMKSDVYVNLPTGYGKSVVFQALLTVFA